MASTVHAVLSASASHRWINCPGCLRLIRAAAPVNVSSIYAEEGSAAHFLAERCLAHGLDPVRPVGFVDRVIRRVGDDGFSILKPGAEPLEGDFIVSDEMAEAVATYIQTIADDFTDGMEIRIEQKFKLDWLYPDMFGTNDCCLLEPFGVLRVYDYKHGAGVPVDVWTPVEGSENVEVRADGQPVDLSMIEPNPQLMYYALGASHGEDFDEVEIVIVQPRARHRDGPVRRLRMTAAYLEEWGRRVLLPAAKRTEAPDAPVSPGDWCRWCPVIGGCRAVHDTASEVAKADFNDGLVTLPPPELLTPAELAKVLASGDLLKKFVTQCEAYSQNLLTHGHVATSPEFPYKLARRRSNRAWIDEKETVSRLLHRFRLDIYNSRLKTPAQMEQLIKERAAAGGRADEKELLAGLIHKPDGGLTIVHESDRRPAVLPPAISDFDDEDEMFA